MVVSVVQSLMYPPLANGVINAISAINFMVLSHTGWKEIKGTNMQYSKLISKTNADDQSKTTTTKKKEVKLVPSKTGMIVAYTPAFLVALSSFFIFPSGDVRFHWLQYAVTTHFFKRLFEVVFVHKYSGSMELEAMAIISLSYLFVSGLMIYSQHLVQTVPEPSIDLKYVGVALFLLGIGGNFYHHYLLSKLRGDGEMRYKIPKGGLFSLVICPHYLFEIMGFLGISFISQTLYPFSFTMGSALLLTGRSYATREWYKSKFHDFPEDVKALIPFIF